MKLAYPKDVPKLQSRTRTKSLAALIEIFFLKCPLFSRQFNSIILMSPTNELQTGHNVIPLLSELFDWFIVHVCILLDQPMLLPLATTHLVGCC